MEELAADVLRRAYATLRGLLRYAPLLALGLVLAALCVDAPISALELNEPTSCGGTEAEPDTNESPDASDEVAAHGTIVVGPAEIAGLAPLRTHGSGRSGYRSRIPRPSGT